MEVHHHPHAPHGPKKFKEYFLELIMIFLAVSLGFLAESFRERITEKKKEREFVSGIISDLKTDTLKLRSVLKYYDHIIPLIYSGRLHFSKLQQAGSMHTVFLIQRSMSGFENFIYTDATLQQIKSSGGMLLITNKAAVDSILLYDAKVRSTLNNEKLLGEVFLTTQHEMGGLLNMQPILESIGRAKSPTAQRAMVDSLNKNMPDFLLTHDPNVSGQFYNDYSYYGVMATLMKMEMTAVREKAIRTIAFLQKEYELGDEE